MTATTSPQTVEQYLEQLRTELAGADPALVQDALYDAQEHLRAELGQQPDQPESAVLERIVASYGAPAEVADAYRSTEARVQAALRPPAPRATRSSLGRFFSVYTDSRAYLSLAYMLLALATGIFYFTFVATGVSLSVGMLMLIVGIPFFLLFVGAARVLALAEGRIVEGLLGVRMPRRPVHPGDRDRRWTERIIEMLKDPHTWGTLVYFALMLPLGVLYFAFAIIGITLSLGLTIGPIFILLVYAGIVQIDGTVEAPPAAVLPLISILGIVLLTVTLHLARGIGYLHGQLAKSLLVPAPRSNDDPPAAA